MLGLGMSWVHSMESSHAIIQTWFESDYKVLYVGSLPISQVDCKWWDPSEISLVGVGYITGVLPVEETKGDVGEMELILVGVSCYKRAFLISKGLTLLASCLTTWSLRLIPPPTA